MLTLIFLLVHLVQVKQLFHRIYYNRPKPYISSRDELYAEIKKTNSSRKTRKILFDRMIDFFNKILEIPKSENPVVYMIVVMLKKI